MSHPIQSEAHLTTFEAISMIVGNSIGTGIIAVPYLQLGRIYCLRAGHHDWCQR